MFKNFGIVIGVCIVGFLVWGIVHTLQIQKTKQANPSEPDNKTVTDLGTGDSDKLTIPQSQGGALQVNNFVKDPKTVADPYNKGFYYLGNHFPESASDNPEDIPPYVIQYIESTQVFNVTLFSEPLAKNRRAAEAYLVAALSVPQEQLCSIKHAVGVPNRVNQDYAGMDLGFSFCPGSVELPE